MRPVMKRIREMITQEIVEWKKYERKTRATWDNRNGFVYLKL